MGSIADELRQRIRGEVHFDRLTRKLYSTDASIYRIDPLGVVIPRDEEDLAAVATLAARERVPLLPRAAGTSLAGQSVGKALALDCSRSMNAILEFNAEERWVRVQPGVVLDRLNAFLRPHGLMFGPDVATSNRACIGGMIGNNSAGARSRVYGMTADHVLELRVLLGDGSAATLGSAAPGAVKRRAAGSGLEASLYREIPALVSAHREEIRRRFPAIQRRVSGYSLNRLESSLAESGSLDLAQLVCGSEGTLAIVTEAKLNLLPRPRCAALGVVAFNDLIAATEATVALLATGPVAIEMVDRLILELAKESREYSRDYLPVAGDPEALLLVEFHGDTEAEVAGKLGGLEAAVRRQFPSAQFARAADAAAQANIWKVRKAGVGLLLGMKSDRKPIAFVEDTAVPPEHLPEYVRRFREIVTRHGTTSGYYGHASVGCLHLRPLINIGNPDDVARMKAIAAEVADLVQEFGGAMTGEHGDGLVRSGWIEKLYGPELLQAFRDVKRAFDPHGILNPGKIVEAPPMDADLRARDLRPLDLRTHLSFAREGGILRAVMQCSGVGICRKREGVMCPSFMATGDERHSTRGRANALRAVLDGELPPDALAGDDLYEALDLCLACKGCQTECPSAVDMARLKVEYLAQRHARTGTPLRATVMGHIDVLSRFGSFAAPVANPLLRSRPVRLLVQAILGIDARRTLPEFAGRTLLQRLSSASRQQEAGGRRQEAGCRMQEVGSNGLRITDYSLPTADHASRIAHHRSRVALFVDTFVNHNCPDVGEAAVALLEGLGCEVVVPKRPCCGRAALSQGLVERARSLARENLERLWPYAEVRIPIVGIEPSCIATLRDEYRDLLDDPRVERLGEQVFLLEEFLVREAREGRLEGCFRARPETAWLHGHCHQKALTGTGPALAALRLIPELEVREIDSGCCGMAGAFGYDRKHYDVSMAVGEDRLFPAIRALPEGALIIAEGISCRQQIEHGTGRRAYHLAEVLRDSLKAGKE
ncbi:MAG: FAD-binding protein [Armatimonadetes bacterium]|nr:FAD-binding protein [Armatimonadota bacterium]